MRLRYLLLGLLLACPIPSYAATSTTLQSAAVADGVGTAASVFDYGEIALQVAITGKANVNFEGSADSGTTYSAIVCRRGGSTSGDVSTTNASGLFFCNATGITNIRTPVVGWQTGTVTVSANVPGDASGGAGVSLETLLSGEDQTNNLLMTSGGVARLTTFSSVTSATSSSVTTVPTGAKTFVAQIINATSETKAATLTIYGNLISSTTGGMAICTITLPSTASVVQLQDACPITTVNFPYYFYTATVYTSASSAPLTVYAAY